MLQARLASLKCACGVTLQLQVGWHVGRPDKATLEDPDWVLDNPPDVPNGMLLSHLPAGLLA